MALNQISVLIQGLNLPIRRLYHDLGSDWLKPIEPARLNRIQKTHADGKSFFLYVGNFRPHKNVTRLVEAFARLVQERQVNDKRLLLVGGDAGNLRRIMKLIHKLDPRRSLIGWKEAKNRPCDFFRAQPPTIFPAYFLHWLSPTGLSNDPMRME